MAKKDRSIKRIIKKKIQIDNKKVTILDNTKAREQPKKSLSTPTIMKAAPSLSKKDRFVTRFGGNLSKFKDYGKYVKEESVDYDVIITIASYNRFEKIDRILNQLFSQETKYKFKVILLNDGSDDLKYEELEYKYGDIIYLKNDVPYGKVGYWKTINTIWEKAKQFKTHGIIQLDDDFILCEHFIDRLLDVFFQEKTNNNNYMVFSFHLYNFEKEKPLDEWWFNQDEVFVDGGMLLDVQFLKKIDYKLNNIENRVTPKTSSYTWVRVKEYLEEFGMRVFRTKNSLVWHDGNDDSKHHPTIRPYKRVYTKNFIDQVNYEQ